MRARRATPTGACRTVTMPNGRVAVVLSGAGARGAFQAGVLATLLPALAAEGTIPSIVLGTSAGSINAALWGSLAHRPVTDAAERLRELWTHLGHRDVYAPLLRTTFTRTPRGVHRRRRVEPGTGTASLFDTTRCITAGRTVTDTDQLARNIAAGTRRPSVSSLHAFRRRPTATTARRAAGRCCSWTNSTQSRTPATPTGPRTSSRAGCDTNTCWRRPPSRSPSRRSASPDPPSAASWYIDGGVR